MTEADTLWGEDGWPRTDDVYSVLIGPRTAYAVLGRTGLWAEELDEGRWEIRGRKRSRKQVLAIAWRMRWSDLEGAGFVDG
jgi:hypothetical protein